MNHAKPLSATGVDLRAAVASRPWAWLNTVARDLDLAIDIAGAGGVWCVPLAESGPALDKDSPALRMSIQAALHSGRVEHLLDAGVEICVVRLGVATGAGVLVVARARAGAGSGTPSDLQHLIVWLASAVEAQLLQGATGEDDSFDRVSSLHRILHDAVERGSEHEVATAFAEALVAWDGVEMSGYQEDTQGCFVRVVTAPGAERGHRTLALDPGIGRSNGALAPLSARQVEQLGFGQGRRVVATDISSSMLEPWLLVFVEGFAPFDETRLRLYVDLLREALGRTSTIAETRMTWAILQQLLGASDIADRAARAALDELARSMAAMGASLLVTTPEGVTVLSAGDDDEAPSSVRPFRGVSRIVSTASILDRYAMALTVRRAPGETFTRREQRLADQAAAIFAAWLPGALRQVPRFRERRSENRDFEQVLDHAVDQHAGEGIDVSILVLSTPDLERRPDLLRKWVNEIRGHLRGADLADALSDCEIGVLLSGVGAESVPAVRARFERCLGLDAQGAPTTSIGSASRLAGRPDRDSLVRTARDRARRVTFIDGVRS